ncbi:hypothetical protein BN109_008 [Yersinia phage phi80-18]|uniref:Uncharacterized protein n=1 Tax=Yersinia phage phi80-18 TaxID=1206559 RepID=I7LET2_9CAUD|nr:hypothetical protein BN109_008 [Yersinia phage phi80-18]CCI88847.2 hypothetical protein BN109_008 [Yersinia phage phi80-18]
MKKNPNVALVAAKASIATLHRELDTARKEKDDLARLASNKFKLDGQHIGELRVSIREHQKIIEAGSDNRAALRSEIKTLKDKVSRLTSDNKGLKAVSVALAVIVAGYALTFYYAGLL